MNFSETWQTWLYVLMNPNEATFELERQEPHATLATAMRWMAAAGLVVGTLGILRAVVVRTIQAVFLQPPLLTDPSWDVQVLSTLLLIGSVLGSLSPETIVGSISAAVTVPVGFLFFTSVNWLAAVILGGQGEYERYVYLNAVYSAPLNILLSLFVAVVPLRCIGLAANIYVLVLTYYATKVEHQLSKGRTIAAMLLSTVLSVLLIVGFSFLSSFLFSLS